MRPAIDPGLAEALTVAPSAASWRPLAVADPAALRPAPPPAPDSAQAVAELAEVRGWLARLTAQERQAIAFWNDAPAPVRWGELAASLALDAAHAPPRASRDLALVHVAIHDATIVAWAAKAAYRRAGPARLDPALKPLLQDPGVPTYPSAHAAAAHAAAGVLAGLFPAHAARLREQATGAAESRLAAGVELRSDAAAGKAIGEAVAAQVLARAAQDGSDALARLPLEGPTTLWNADYPADAVAGGWRTWFLADVAALRPAAPPFPGTPAYEAERAAARATIAASAPATKAAAGAWYEAPAPLLWHARARALVAARRPDPPHAARALAYLGTAVQDAAIASWGAQYAIRMPYPAALEPRPPRPAFPADAAAVATAAGDWLAEAFPQDAQAIRQAAAEAGQAGILQGFQLPRDVAAGEAIGRAAAAATRARAAADGAAPNP